MPEQQEPQQQEDQVSESDKEFVGAENFWPAAQPDSYADLRTEDEGEYKYLLSEGKEIGIVWTNWNDGTGILWTESTPVVLDIFKKLIVMKKMGETAGVAYSMLDTINGTEFSEPVQGPLAGVDEAFDKLGNSRG